MKANNHKNIIKFVMAVMVIGSLAGVLHTFAFNGPTGSAGSGAGALSTDVMGDVGVGTSTTQSNTRIFILGSTTDSSAYGLQIWNSARTLLFTVRNDGVVSIPGVTSLGSLTGTTLTASNISAGQFGNGSGNFYFPASVGIGTTSGAGTLDIYNGAATGFTLTNTDAIFGRDNSSIATTSANQAPATFINNFNSYTGLYLRKTSTGAGDYFAVDTSTSSPIFYIKSSGNVGIGTVSPSSVLQVETGILASTTNSVVEMQRWSGNNTNANYLDVRHIRTSAGTDWTSAGTRIQQKIDSTWMGYIQFNGSNNNFGISFGAGSTTTAPGNVAEAMRINNNGNVGIGTASPSSTVKLDVNGKIYSETGGFVFPDNTVQTTAYTGTSTQVVNASNVTAGQFGAGNSSFPSALSISTTSVPASALFYVATSSNILTAWNNGNVTVGGNVGIGTTSASAPLYVKRPYTANSAVATFFDASSSFLSVIPQLGSGGYNPLSSSGDFGFIFGNTGGSDIAPGNILTIAPWSTAKSGIRISSTTTAIYGNVGFGTAAPLTVMQVEEAGQTLTGSAADAAAYSKMNLMLTTSDSGAADTGPAIGFGGIYNAGGNKGVFAGIAGRKSLGLSDRSGYLSFYTNTSGGLTEKMRIDYLGNVGIGVISTTSTLSVAGEIKTTTGGVRFPDNTLQTTAYTGTSTQVVNASNVTAGQFAAGNFSFPSNVSVGTGATSNSVFTVYGGATSWNSGIELERNDGGDARINVTYNEGLLLKNYSTSTGAFDLRNYADSHLVTGLTNGNVGIDEVSPQNTLDVNGGMAVGSYAGANTAGSGNLIVSGNVGIGTTGPGSRLDIVGTNSANDKVTFPEAAGWFEMAFSSNDAGVLGVIDRGSGNSAKNLYFGQTSDTGKYIFRSSGDFTIQGNVGIGTTNPGTYELNVTGGNIYGSANETLAGTTGLTLLGAGADLNFAGTGPNTITTASGVNLALMPGGTGNVGIGTTGPLSTLSVGGAGIANAGIYGTGGSYGVYGNSSAYGSYGVYGHSSASNSFGVFGQAGSPIVTGGVGVYGHSGGVDDTAFGVYGDVPSNGSGIGVVANGGNSGDGVSASGGVGVFTTSCSGCSVLAEMVPVAETPNNGDVMCTNLDTGEINVCTADKSDYIEGIAQKYAENIMRMGCSNTLDSKNGTNGQSIGVMNVDAVLKTPACKGWYPIALSGLSEKTNVVCQTPNGKRLGYGDVLVSSNVPGLLRPLDKGEAVEPYQIAGKASSVCALGNATDSIKVWIN